MQWYVSQNRKTSGPFDEQRLIMLLQWGKVSRNAFICDEQCSAWIPIKCSAFAPLLPRPAELAGAPEGACVAAPTRARRVYGALAVALRTRHALVAVSSALIVGLLMASI